MKKSIKKIKHRLRCIWKVISKRDFVLITQLDEGKMPLIADVVGELTSKDVAAWAHCAMLSAIGKHAYEEMNKSDKQMDINVKAVNDILNGGKV